MGQLGEKELEGQGREMEGVSGWRRSHRHRVYDSLLIGVGREPEKNLAVGYLVVHG